jgi:hypothetical protein
LEICFSINLLPSEPEPPNNRIFLFWNIII